ncbi:Calcium-dependent protein kinase 34, partial [Tetrabaena socialis]
ILNDIDLDGNSKIDYEEFLASTMHLNKLSREENMIAAFEHFDLDKSGFITHDELANAMKGIDQAVNVDQLLATVDKNGDGKIDYEEFCQMMRATDITVLKTAHEALKSKVFLQSAVAHVQAQPVREDSFGTLQPGSRGSSGAVSAAEGA